MSCIVPPLERAQAILKKHVSDWMVLNHCIATQRKAEYISRLVGWTVSLNLPLVRIGALLHDIGRARVHDITHGVVGGQILKKEGLHECLIRIVERHVLGGFTVEEAILLGFPRRNFLPETWEEKIVCVADKLGHYYTHDIKDPKTWLPMLQNRFAVLRERYGGGEPYESSMQRANLYVKTLTKLALKHPDLIKRV